MEYGILHMSDSIATDMAKNIHLGRGYGKSLFVMNSIWTLERLASTVQSDIHIVAASCYCLLFPV